jgi:hypothetical protein
MENLFVRHAFVKENFHSWIEIDFVLELYWIITIT